MRSTGLREKTRRHLTLKNSSPYCSDRTLWRGWAQVQTWKEHRNCPPAQNLVRGRQKQQAAIKSPVAVGATSALLISPSHQGRNWGHPPAERFIPWPHNPNSLINCNYFLSSTHEWASMHDQALSVWFCRLQELPWPGTKTFNLKDACNWLRAGTAAPPWSRASHISLAAVHNSCSHFTEGHRLELVPHNLWSPYQVILPPPGMGEPVCQHVLTCGFVRVIVIHGEDLLIPVMLVHM